MGSYNFSKLILCTSEISIKIPSNCTVHPAFLVCQKRYNTFFKPHWSGLGKKKSEKNPPKSVNKHSQTWHSQRLKSERSQSYIATPSLVVMAQEEAPQRTCPLLCLTMKQKFLCSNLGITLIFLELQNKERHENVLPGLSIRDAQDPEIQRTVS